MKKTKYQFEILEKCPHFIPIAKLPDGDILVVDKTTIAASDHFITGASHYGPYVVTLNGFVQDINYHYAKYHNLEIAF